MVKSDHMNKARDQMEKHSNVADLVLIHLNATKTKDLQLYHISILIIQDLTLMMSFISVSNLSAMAN